MPSTIERLTRSAASDLDGFLEICHPEIVLVSRHLELDGSGHLRGHESVRRWWETLLAVYPDFASEVDDMRDLGDVTSPATTSAPRP